MQSPVRGPLKATSGSLRRTSSILALLTALGSAGCLEPRNEEALAEGEDPTRCTACHGDPKRSGDALLRSAPPGDVNRNTDVIYPGVGTHQLHLTANDRHAAIACSECHLVPESASATGHADDDRPAEVIFGELAKTGDLNPKYEAGPRRCSDTYCHQGNRPQWTRPRSDDQICGSCHGLPPPAPHPQADNCSACHSKVVGEDERIADPDKHLDGIVQYDPPACQRCHGDGTSPAPPKDVAGNKESSFLGVGAHSVHIEGTDHSRPLECAECHLVPQLVEDPQHVDGLPAEVIFSSVALTQMREPSWDHDRRSCTNTWCHGPGPADSGSATDEVTASPDWTSNGPLDCTSCHGTPPPAPHPQMSQCSVCHGEVIGQDGQIAAPDLHVNGEIEVEVPTNCTACHGNQNAAPPTDTQGNAATSFEGVGAHQTHVLGTKTSRAVPCAECHEVPSQVLEQGHIDSSLPAELAFSGVAVQYGAPISYENGSCQNSYCHGAVFFDGRLSGGTNTEPEWTQVDGSGTQCGSCHGLPPPKGHPQYDDCQSCHRNVKPDNRSFFDPKLHVNGITENYIP